MRNIISAGTLFICAFASSIQAAELSTVEQKASYAFGIDILNNLKKQGLELDAEAFTQGIKDAASGREPRLDAAQRTEAKSQLQQQIRDKLLAEQNALAEKNLKAGEDFLKANANKQGVKVTDSGLQYRVIEAGTGKTPKASDTVVTHYRGTLIDGTEFDSSYSRGAPTSFTLNEVIPGWTEGVQLMSIGSKYRFVIPFDLGYGERGAGGQIGPFETLIFEVELLEIKS